MIQLGGRLLLFFGDPTQQAGIHHTGSANVLSVAKALMEQEPWGRETIGLAAGSAERLDECWIWINPAAGPLPGETRRIVVRQEKVKPPKAKRVHHR